MKKSWQDYGREWLDTLVVAISVAMAFRAYFYEPFNIPTGSMQETLWGYHTVREERVGVNSGSGSAEFSAHQQPTTNNQQPTTHNSIWDKAPLSWLKWAWTGERVVDYKASVSGQIAFGQRGDGFADIVIVQPSGKYQKACKLPTDALKDLGPQGRHVSKGETLWAGKVITGDFIFVNRWAWNFRKPKDGDVMIFSTTGIDKLPQGTHYIKRMKATPGETYVLEHPVPGYPSTVTMGEDEYFACGDNYNNSFDSRYWGVVPGRQLRGLGSVVFWPFSGWRIIR